MSTIENWPAIAIFLHGIFSLHFLSHTVKAVQCDNGREFDNSTSQYFFLSRGVQLRMSCLYTSPQNGKAERMIRTTNDVVRTILI
jgi:hypothetical protein